MSKDLVHALLDDSENYRQVAQKIVDSGNKELLFYVLEVGINKIAAGRRAQHRQQIRPMIKEELVPRRGGAAFSVELSDRTTEKLKRAAVEVLKWPIGGTKLGDFTRDALLQHASRERASGKGHVKNALFYERLAQPMNDVDTVLEHWKSPEAAMLIKNEIWHDAETKEVGLVREYVEPANLPA